MTETSPYHPSIELLAPAGDETALRAAIANGAQAVYLGVREFNARLRAGNFDAAGLKDTVALCHRYNVRVYLAMNTLILPDEWSQAEELAQRVAEAGVDAVIVQDVGLADWFHRCVPSMPLHASTQMTLSEPEAINQARDAWGIRRVILPRELSTDEIRAIRRQTDVELEVFVHGALCISYSGQCHASFFMGGRSANRGACAQPCRLPYILSENGQPVETDGKHLISPKDFCGLDYIRERIEAGVTCFKIEGRLKNADYVAATVAIYREAIRAACEAKAPDTTRDKQALAILFARGQTNGYARGDDHVNLVDPRLVGHQGLLLGTLTRVTPRSVSLLAEPDLAYPPQPGDGVAFDYPDAEGRRAGARIYQARRVSSSSKGVVYELGFGRDDVDLSTLKPGITLWKTSDPALDRTLRQSYAKIVTPHPRPVDFELFMKMGHPAALTVRDARGHEARAVSECIIEPSRTRPVTADLLREQLSRLGDTPFTMGNVTLLGVQGPVESLDLMMPKSVLNELRRQVVGHLQKLCEPHHAVIPDELCMPFPGSPAQTTMLKWIVRSGEQLEALLEQANHLYTPFGICPELESEEATREAFQRIREAGIQAGLSSPRVVTESQMHLVEKQINLRPDFYLARSWGAFKQMKQHHPDVFITGDFSLNLSNARAAALALRGGMRAFTPALELTPRQQGQLAAQTGAGCLEWLVYFHPILFYTQYCLYAHHLGTGKGFPQCGKTCKTRRLALEDRKGVIYSAIRDAAGRMQIMRRQPVRELERLESDEWIGGSAFRIELLHEDRDQTVELAAEATDRLHAVERRNDDE